jgi:uncharacterized membrane protein
LTRHAWQMKPALWFLCGGVAGAVALLAQDGVTDWAERFAAWTATRNLDEPVRNAVHLRQTVTVANQQGVEAILFVVPANRRLALEQLAVYCLYANGVGSLRQVNVASLAGAIAARYPLLPTVFEGPRDTLAGLVRMYADPLTPVQVTVIFSYFTTGVCEITGTGHLAQLNP